MVAHETPFRLSAPISIFRKAGAAPDDPKSWRIGGVVSTELPDREQEIVLQRGLDFSDFMKAGWFNDNHSKRTCDILGYPEQVKRFQKGAPLPDGKKAPANCTWVEGYLIPKWNKAKEVWDLAQALQPTDRRLRFSVEGKVLHREGPDKKIVAKATVRNIAITNAPINDDTRLEVLVKSLMDAEKGLTMGDAHPGQPDRDVTMTGEGAGQILARQSLEHDKQRSMKVLDYPAPQPKRKKSKKARKGLNTAEAISWVKSRCPGVSEATAQRVVDLARLMSRQRPGRS